VTIFVVSLLASQVASSHTDASIAAAAAVVGALVGALASVIPNWLIEKYRLRREAEHVEASLVAEISGLIEIASERKYVQGLNDAATYLRTQPEGSTFRFDVRIPDHYSRIYQANAQRIGLLPPRRAADIVRFHQLADAVVQDLIPGGVISRGAPVEAFEQNVQILSRALALGNAIVSRKP